METARCTWMFRIFLIHCILLITEMALGHAMTKVLMSRYPGLEGRNVTTSIINIATGPKQEQEALSVAYCAEKCADVAKCTSFFFNSVNKQCQFHEDLLMKDERAKEQPGMRYYYKMMGIGGWCPIDKGFQLLKEDGPCVKFHTDVKTWYEAKQICESYSPNSRLVVLDNPEKNELVKAAGMAINDSFRIGVAIGLSDLREGIYRWVDGREVIFTDWSSLDRSVAGRDNCVVLYRTVGGNGYDCPVELGITTSVKLW